MVAVAEEARSWVVVGGRAHGVEKEDVPCMCGQQKQNMRPAGPLCFLEFLFFL
jgi:hypothetical protein